MKTANSKYSQKGFSLIGIVIIIIVVIAVLATVAINIPKVNQQITNTQTSQTSSQAIPGLDMVDGSNYTFYYPKGYVKLDKKYSDITVLYYAQPSKANTDEGITLAMDSVSTRMDTPSSESCKETLQFFLRKTKNVRIVDAKPVDYIKSHGCDFHTVDDSTKLVSNERNLWFKEGNDLNIYSANARYLVGAPQQEVDNLNLAINNFILK